MNNNKPVARVVCPWLWVLTAGATLSGIAGMTAAEPASGPPPQPALSSLSFEELSKIKVTIATKRPESLNETPAAVYVLTGDELCRSGATTFPDALRYVPGLDVAMVNSSQWAVSSRGFNGQYANQLLVMMDGRSVYNPSFGGVIWDAQDMVFEDIDRIEVVRGPGGALWGANAVNGVINIVTKPASETQGLLVKAGGGSFNEAISAARYGFKISEKTFGRVYAKYDLFGETPLSGGSYTPDDWWRAQGGFRVDSQPDAANTFTLQGDVHRVDQGAVYQFPTFTPPRYVTTRDYRIDDTGADLLGRWTHDFSATSALSLQTYYDYYEQKGPVFSQRLHTFDLDAQHHFDLGERQTITWGAGFRATWDTIYARSIVSTPNRPQADDQLANIFVQDEIALVRDKLSMTLGVKMEHNDYTGWECSPTARLLWHPTERQTLWGAVSRAVATPNHASSDVAYNLRVLPSGARMQILGQSDHVEELLAYEIGYRIQPVDRVSVDVTAFYNDYDNLLALEPGAVIPGTPPVMPVYWVNNGPGRTHGVELAVGWQPVDHWQLKGGYTWFESDVIHASAGRDDGGASPEHQFNLRSIVDLGAHWEWDTGFRFVSELESINVPAYFEMDMRLAWKPVKHWELALVGQNLLQDMHFEYPRGLNPMKSEVVRSVYATVTARF